MIYIIVKRGEVYYAQLDPVIGSEQGGNRPVLILQNNFDNVHSATVLIAPITSKKPEKKYLITHQPIIAEFLQKNSIVLLEQMRTIDKSRLEKYLGRIDLTQMNGLAKGIKFSTGLKVPEKKGKSKYGK